MHVNPQSHFARCSRYVLRLALVLFCLHPALGAWGSSRYNYVSHLLALEGVPYDHVSCSQYICLAKQQPYCSSREIYAGCGGALELIEQVPSLDQIDYSRLRAGDVADFHGIHVAAYITRTTWVDSDPQHGGVGIIRVQPGDPWFQGPIRVLRWRDKDPGTISGRRG